MAPRGDERQGLLPLPVTAAARAGEVEDDPNARRLAGDDKKIVDFYLGNWMARRGMLGMLEDVRRVQRMISTDLQTATQRRYPLSAAQTALDMFRANMTAGKALLVADPMQVPLSAVSGT